MNLAKRIIAEIRFQDQAFAAELDDWQALSIDDEHFRLHRSQIARITRTLSSARKTLGLTTLEPGHRSDDQLLRSLQDRRMRLRALHLLWNFFRQKLLQRLRSEFQAFLLVADDLAWACYQPFLRALESPQVEFKEPPLTFLSMEPGPFAQSRESSFVPAGLSSRERSRLYRVIRKLPVPLIGLPWQQMGSAPELVLVGHEAGHIVAEDLGLADEFAEVIESIAEIPDERKLYWSPWLDEVFADVFGILATGCAYGFSLVRALAGDLGRIRGEQPDLQGSYPPRAVRVRLVQACAVMVGVDTRFADDWHALYPPMASGFVDDVEPLVQGLLTYGFRSLGGATLGALLSPPDRRVVDMYADNLLDNMRLEVTGPFSIRAAVAGAGVAHARDATRWGEMEANLALMTHVARHRDDGEREGDVPARNELVSDDTRIGSARCVQTDDSVGREISSLLCDEPAPHSLDDDDDEETT